MPRYVPCRGFRSSVRWQDQAVIVAQNVGSSPDPRGNCVLSIDTGALTSTPTSQFQIAAMAMVWMPVAPEAGADRSGWSAERAEVVATPKCLLFKGTFGFEMHFILLNHLSSRYRTEIAENATGRRAHHPHISLSRRDVDGGSHKPLKWL
jgi:hypothetical protein